jgi:hypothetical protein
MRYLIPALQDFGAMLKGRRVAPVELYDPRRKARQLASNWCVYRKLKPGRSGGEARRGSGVNE